MMEPDVKQMLADRGVAVPAEDVTPLEEHWKKMRRLRSQVNEALLADHEIAVTWTALQEDHA